jgi:hypothetical protein
LIERRAALSPQRWADDPICAKAASRSAAAGRSQIGLKVQPSLKEWNTKLLGLLSGIGGSYIRMLLLVEDP